jgi:hypothetical protein
MLLSAQTSTPRSTRTKPRPPGSRPATPPSRRKCVTRRDSGPRPRSLWRGRPPNSYPLEGRKGDEVAVVIKQRENLEATEPTVEGQWLPPFRHTVYRSIPTTWWSPRRTIAKSWRRWRKPHPEVNAARWYRTVRILTDQDSNHLSQIALLLDRNDGRIAQTTALSGEKDSRTRRDRHPAMVTDWGRLA